MEGASCYLTAPLVSKGDGEARLDMAHGVCDGADRVTELSGLPGMAIDGINREGDGPQTTLPPPPPMSPWDLGGNSQEKNFHENVLENCLEIQF